MNLTHLKRLMIIFFKLDIHTNIHGNNWTRIFRDASRRCRRDDVRKKSRIFDITDMD